jgi:hypothetical protein
MVSTPTVVIEPRLRLGAAAVAGAFLLNGVAFGAWAARIPAVQAQTHLDEAAAWPISRGPAGAAGPRTAIRI